MVTTLRGPDSILGQAREAQRWTEQLLQGTSQPIGTAMWKMKGLVNRVQMLPPQLLRLLVKTGVVGGHVDHCGWVAGDCQGKDSPRTKLDGAIGNLRCALWIPYLVCRNAGVRTLGWPVFLYPVVLHLALGPYLLPSGLWLPPVTPPITWT